jgi:nucleoside-diphosphate-sugar epimerase
MTDRRAEAGTVLLTGATAQVGLHLLPALQAAGFRTLALSRKIPQGKSSEHLVIESIRWIHPDEFRDALENTRRGFSETFNEPELLISAGPITLAVELLQCCPGIKRVVCLSTSSVFSKAESGDPAEREQIARILRAEQQLQELSVARELDLCLLRPTMIYGCGMDENVSRMAAFIRRFGFLPLAGQATGKRQPIHVADLARLMVRICQSGFTGQTAFVVAGGSTLSYREMAAKIFQALGKSPRMYVLPAGLLATATKLLGNLSGMKGLNEAMVLRQNQDLVFDDRDTRQVFNFHPRVFNPGPEDFTLPAELQRYLPTT